jgi:hypothetical protein
MNVARSGHTATLLNNGKVLVVGGKGNPSYHASTELYDPITTNFSITDSMSVARSGNTATLLNNGKVLVAGGYNGSYLASSELYDPVAVTWTLTGNMNISRNGQTATLLNDGKVLVVGGYNGIYLASAELYDPVAGTWTLTGNMNHSRTDHTATLMNNGKVLVAGGNNGTLFASAELYDPATGIWTFTDSMNISRNRHTATLLNDGKVLVAGGYNGSYLASSELYDPVAGTWTPTGNMTSIHVDHTATLMNNGKVLVAGGVILSSLTSGELYDPATGTWSTIDFYDYRFNFTATLLNNGKVLVAGGSQFFMPSVIILASAELGTLIPGNVFTSTLSLPAGWLNSTIISAQFIGTSSGAAINAGSLSNGNIIWGSWIAANPGETITTTWEIDGEGANETIYLRLRDINDQVATVVTGTVNVDLTKPTSIMTALPSFSPDNISLFWSGSDELSGVSTYDVQVRAGMSGVWIDILSNTTDTSTIYTGVDGITYYFRIRASDLAGNVEDWPPDYDTFTFVEWRLFFPLILN